MVVASRPCILNSSVQAASTAHSTTGRYSGLHPAITALMATFSTVHSARSGGTTATTSCGERLVPSSIRSTRASVGGTTGIPSLKPRSNMASMSSSNSAISIRRLFSVEPEKRMASSSLRLGSTLKRAASGPPLGKIGSETVESGELFPLLARPTDYAIGLGTVSHSQQRRHGLDLVMPRQAEIGIMQLPSRRIGGTRGRLG